MTKSPRNLKVEYRNVASLKPYAGNPRTHSPKQVRQIADSIVQFGFTLPILVDARQRVLAGHGRLQAARLLGLERVPTICLDYLSRAQKRAYLIADNKLAENAGWNRELLALELQYLSELEINFDLTITGFETAKIDLMIQGLDSNGAADDANEISEISESSQPVSRLGDLWLLDEHRLLCADATEKESFERLLAGKKAQTVLTDPPYNVPINGHVCGSGSIKHGEFIMAAGELSEGEFTSFLKTILGHLATNSVDGSIHFVFIDWRHIFELLSAARAIYTEVKNLCVWNKDNGGMGSLY